MPIGQEPKHHQQHKIPDDEHVEGGIDREKEEHLHTHNDNRNNRYNNIIINNNMAFVTRKPSSGGLQRSFYEAKLRRGPRSGARRCTLFFVLMLGSLAVIYEAMWTYWLAGVNIPDVERDPQTGQERVRRRPDLSVKYDPSQHNQVHTYVKNQRNKQTTCTNKNSAECRCVCVGISGPT